MKANNHKHQDVHLVNSKHIIYLGVTIRYKKHSIGNKEHTIELTIEVVSRNMTSSFSCKREL